MKLEKKISDMHLKEKKKMIEEVCVAHNKILLTNKIKIQQQQLLGEKAPVDKTESILDLVLDLLSVDEKLILEKDFLKKNKDKYWFKTHWSKNTYYTKKHKAIDKVLYYMHA